MRRCFSRRGRRPWSVLAIALAVLAAATAATAADAPGRHASGAITVSIDALDSYVPEQDAAYWVVNDLSVDVPVMLSEPWPDGSVSIPFVSNAMSSSLVFSGGVTRRTHTITYPTGGKPFYPGWTLNFAYFALLLNQPSGIQRGTPHTLYPIQVQETPTAGAAGEICDCRWLCELLTFLGLHTNVECMTPGIAGAAANAGTALFVPTLQRYRDEVLATTVPGQYYIGVHDAYALDIIRTIASVPSLAARIFLKKTAWVDGLDALVNGQGDQYTVTQQMQDDLLELLQVFEQNGPPALANMIAFERGRLQLDTIAGRTMTQYQTQIETLGGPMAVEDRAWGQVKRLYRGED